MQLARKLFHMSGVLVVLIYQFADPSRTLVAALLWGVVAGQLVVDLLRSRIPALQALFQRVLKPILDPKDERGVNTSTLYFAGCALTATLFAKPLACAGILALALGDPSAALVGRSVRSPRWGKVSLAGSTACLVMATLGCALYAPWPAALAAGAVATLLEAVSGAKLDNFTIPVGAALMLHLLA